MEFSQRPAHSTLPGAHGFMAASPAHYQYSADSQPAHYATSPYSQQQANDTYPITPRRLPSVSELLTPQDSQQVAGYAPQLMQIDRQQQQQHNSATGYTGSGSYSVVESQKPFGIDVPGSRGMQPSTDYAGYHRDSESASSVSSQGTLVDSHMPPHHQHSYKQQLASDYKDNSRIYQSRPQQQQQQNQQQALEADRSVCEEDVFTAASILMSLRTCKMPC
ncbi:hypothetical protein GQ54DRAFT_304786 [Martensiomyces pterosporus]|nr:hypothetical protein GQ54DRAFT_304786 [Martensiomyces pterosporus]